MKTNIQTMNEAMEREGDPTDQTLNAVEEYCILPRIIENKIRDVHCKPAKNALDTCRNKFGAAFSILCFFDTISYGYCLSSERGSDDVKDDCMDEYVALRSNYRLNRDPESLHRFKAFVFPHKYKSNKS